MQAAALLLALALLLARLWPQWCRWPAAEQAFSAWAERPLLAPLSVFVLLVASRLALLPVMSWPAGIAGDDSSLTMLAQTLLAGRLVNPPHPFADFIEAVYVHQQPGYGSMFFPGRGFELALGIMLADEPALGTLLVWALAAAALVWAVRLWVSAPAGLAIGIIFALNYGLFSYMANRLLGHGLPVLGGMLMIGAWHQLRSTPTWASGLVFAAGLSALALTRPLEGALFALPLGLVLVWRSWCSVRAALPAFVPLVLLLGASAALLLASNAANTGNPLRFAYDVNRVDYAGTPAFIFQKAVPATHPMPASLKEHYANEGRRFADYAKPGAIPRSIFEKLASLWAFYAGPLLSLPLLLGAGLWLRRQPELLAGAGLVLAAFMLQQWAHPHYLAPLFGLIMLTTMAGAHALAQRGPGGLALARGLLVGAAVVPMLAVSFLLTGWPRIDDPARRVFNRQFCCQSVRHFGREAVVARLSALGGRHLIFVRFRPGDDHWVFNDADVDAAPIIWAHDLGEARNAVMARHYADRRVWLADGTDPAAVRPYRPG